MVWVASFSTTSLEVLSATNGATDVISNFAVGYFATSKKSGLFKWPSNFPLLSASEARSLLVSDATLMVNEPPVNALSFTSNAPSEIAKVPLCLPVGFVPSQDTVLLLSRV